MPGETAGISAGIKIVAPNHTKSHCIFIAAHLRYKQEQQKAMLFSLCP